MWVSLVKTFSWLRTRAEGRKNPEQSRTRRHRRRWTWWEFGESERWWSTQRRARGPVISETAPNFLLDFWVRALAHTAHLDHTQRASEISMRFVRRTVPGQILCISIYHETDKHYTLPSNSAPFCHDRRYSATNRSSAFRLSP
jgi:hypothetical protein